MTGGDDGGSREFTYEERVLAYIDILGWKEIVSRSAKGAKNEEAGLDDVATAMRALETFAIRGRSIQGHVNAVGADLEVTLFSDTAVLSCAPYGGGLLTMLNHVQSFCVDLMLAGIYTRGAIVVGQLVHRGAFIVGPALVQAHVLESTVAKFPRILLADNVVSLILGLPLGIAGTPRVEADRDTLLILNPFATLHDVLSVCRDRMLAVQQRAHVIQLKHYADVSIRAKMGWLITFLAQQLERIPAAAVEPSPQKEPGS